MEIPKELLKKWKVLKAFGDPGDIVLSMPEHERVSEQTIRNAFENGKCSEMVFKAMAEFYQKRAEIIAQYVHPASK